MCEARKKERKGAPRGGWGMGLEMDPPQEQRAGHGARHAAVRGAEQSAGEWQPQAAEAAFLPGRRPRPRAVSAPACISSSMLHASWRLEAPLHFILTLSMVNLRSAGKTPSAGKGVNQECP